VSDTTVIRERFTLDDRTFTVLAEPWYDATSGEWVGRFLYLPLDRSLPHPVSTGAVKRATQRDDVVRQLGATVDRELARALRHLVPRRTRRARVR
jgi:hypothetical protein